MSAFHIRCSETCSCPGDPLYVASCGSCLYHAKCSPGWCRCGLRLELGKKLEVGRCVCDRCTSSCQSSDVLLCKRHLAALDAMVLSKVSILGRVATGSFAEMVEYHFGQSLKGDLAYLVSLAIYSAPVRMWQVVQLPGGGDLVYFSIALHRHVQETGESVRDALGTLGLPGAAFALVCDDARLHKNGWMLDSDRQPVVATLERAYDKATLLRKIRAHPRATVEVSRLVPLYEMAAGDLLELVAEGKVCKVDNGRLVCVNTEQTFDPGLRDYWMEQVAPGLKTRE